MEVFNSNKRKKTIDEIIKEFDEICRKASITIGIDETVSVASDYKVVIDYETKTIKVVPTYKYYIGEKYGQG